MSLLHIGWSAGLLMLLAAEGFRTAAAPAPPGLSAAAADAAASAPASRPADPLAAAWAAMRDEDPIRGHQAAWEMAAAGDPAVPFIEAQLDLRPPSAERMTELIGQLDSDKFAVRQAASEELGRLGVLAEAGLRKALEGKLSAEARARIAELLDTCANPLRQPEGRRMVRAVGVLESISNGRSGRLLQRMADGSPWGSAAAREALARLGTPAAAPAPKQKNVVVVWTALLPERELVENVLAGSAPLPGDANHCMVFRCDAARLRAACQPLTEREDAVGLNSDQWAHPLSPGESPTANTKSWTRILRDDRGRHIPCGFSIIAFHRFYPDTGPSSLSVDLRGLHMSISGEEGSKSQHASAKIACPIRPGRAVCVLGDMGQSGPHHPYVLMVYQCVGVEPAEVPYFQLRRKVSDWLLRGPEGISRLAKEGLAWNRAAAGSGRTTDPKWTRRLANGATVHLVAIRDLARHPFQAWDGDGWPVALSPDYSGETTGFILNYEARSADGNTRQAGTTTLKDPILTIGLGAGPWKEADGLKVGQALRIGDANYLLSEARSSQRKGLFNAGSITVRMDYTQQADVEVAVGAISRKGRLVLPEECLVVHLQVPRGRFPGLFFRNLPIDITDVDRYVLLTRPRIWTTFDNLPRAPREAATQPASAPAGAPAARDGL